MKRTACVFIRKEPFYRRSAVETGLKRLGYTISDRVVWPSKKEDALVIWNKKAGAEEDRADQWEARGGTVIVMENGYLQQVDKTYYAISAHGHNGSGYYPVGDDLRFPKLGFTLKPWRNGLGEMLVRAQRGVGSRSMASPASVCSGAAVSTCCDTFSRSLKCGLTALISQIRLSMRFGTVTGTITRVDWPPGKSTTVTKSFASAGERTVSVTASGWSLLLRTVNSA